MIIALIGNDGSGKTTLASRLEKDLRKAHPERQVIRLPEFNYVFLNLLRKLSGQGKNADVQASRQTDTEAGPKTEASSLATRLLPFVMLVDTSLQTWYLRLFKRRSLIIKDRSLFDYLATWRELNVANSLVEFLYRHAPKPDVTFYVTVDPEVSRARRIAQNDGRTAKNLKFYQLKRRIYDDIAPRHRIMPLDNNGDFTATTGELRLLVDFRLNIERYRRIAISGLDGAGKSTTIEAFSGLLEALNVPYRSIHFYYNYSPLKVLRRLKGVKPTAEASGTSDEASNAPDETTQEIIQKQYQKSIAHEQKSTGAGKSKLWLVCILGDALLQYYLIRLVSPGRVIIFDRFFPDYFVSFDFLKVDYNKNTLSRIFPKPDLYFLQTADYKVLHTRKPEHTLQFFKQCHAAYARLSREHGMIELNSTTKSPDDLLLELTNVIGKGRTNS